MPVRMVSGVPPDHGFGLIEPLKSGGSAVRPPPCPRNHGTSAAQYISPPLNWRISGHGSWTAPKLYGYTGHGIGIDRRDRRELFGAGGHDAPGTGDAAERPALPGGVLWLAAAGDHGQQGQGVVVMAARFGLVDAHPLAVGLVEHLVGRGELADLWMAERLWFPPPVRYVVPLPEPGELGAGRGQVQIRR